MFNCKLNEYIKGLLTTIITFVPPIEFQNTAKVNRVKFFVILVTYNEKLIHALYG